MTDRTVSTQQQHPQRATWRTVVQNVVGFVLVAGVVAPLVVQVIDEELGQYLPAGWVAWLVGAGMLAAAISGAVARIMAIPAVDAALRRFGLSSTPQDSSRPK